MLELINLSEKDESLIKEIQKIEKQIKKIELIISLSGEYDKNNVILSIYSGSGGQDAEDWANILLRMYLKYAKSKGWQIKILDQVFGQDKSGIKQACLEIVGQYSYGLLKKEKGVHRLVRLSPFSAKALRHTSFALVEILPDISKQKLMEIKESDLKLDLFRSSGAGGMNVNARSTAVRITHIPTNIKVTCQSERSQIINREKALSILKSKIFQLQREKEAKAKNEMKSDFISASWGNQIRSYILHPYKMVKDLRTGKKTSNIDKFLNGDLDILN